MGDDFNGEVILLDIDVRTMAYGFHQSSLNLSTGVIGMVEDAEL